MTKRELEKQGQAQLVYMCEGKGLDHTGDKKALIARLVEAEQAESEQAKEPEVEPPATEPEKSEQETEPEE